MASEAIERPPPKQVSAVPRGQRLVLSALTVNNFKSYYGLAAIGPFHESFTAIVGPNGSGKSNVIDSLLFVFGRRAQQLRLKTLSELIHKSAEHPDCSFCEVTAHFHLVRENDSKAVEGSSFTISRRVTKDSVAVYQINGKKSKYEDVQTWLSRYEVDLFCNRFLILQGEVEAIAMMKPKAVPGSSDIGVLEYLDEIIGTNRFVEPIEAQGKNVEQLNEQRNEKLNRLKLTEKEKDAAEAPRNEALEYCRKENESLINRAHIVQCNVFIAEKEANEAQKKKDECTKQFDETHAQFLERSKEAEGVELSFNTKKDEFDTTQRAMNEAKTAHESAERKLVKNREDVKHCKEKQKKASEKLKKDEKSLLEMKAQSEHAARDIPTLQADLEKKSKLKEKAEKEYEQMLVTVREQTGGITADLQRTQKELIPLKKHVNKANAKVTEINAEITELDERKSASAKALKDAATQIADAKTHFTEKQSEVKSADRQLSDARSAQSKCKEELAAAEESERTLNDQRSGIYSRREEARSALQSSKSRDAMYSSLMDQKKKGHLSGLYGRLGELAAIDEKYDVAVSTAIGELRSFVTDKIATAEACIRHLKEKALGIADFIALDRVSFTAEHWKAIQTPENIPRLFDLIKVKDAAYLPAFFKAMRDTLVATDLKQALRVQNALGRKWRVVTLDGKMVEANGSLSGGGNVVLRGGMSNKLIDDNPVDPRELKVMDSTLSQIEAKLTAVRESKEQFASTLSTLTKTISKTEVAIKKLQIELRDSTASIADLEKRVPDLEAAAAKANSKEEASKKKELSSELKVAEKALADANTNTAELEAKIAELEAKLMAAGGAKLKTLQSKVEALDSEIDALNTSVSKANVLIETNVKKVKKTESAIEGTKAEIEECGTRLVELNAEQKDIEESTVKVANTFHEAERLQKEKFAELSTIQKQYEAVKKMITAVKEQEIEITNQIDTFEHTIKEKKKLVKHGAKQLSDLTKQIEETAQILADDETAEAELAKSMQASAQSADVAAVAAAAVAAAAGGSAASSSASTAPAAAPAPSAPSADSKMAVDEKGEPIVKPEPDVKDAKADAAAAAKPKRAVWKPLTDAELESFDRKEAMKNVAALEEALKKLKPNMHAIEEYQRKAKEWAARLEALDKITAERDAARKQYDSLRKQRLDEFMSGFSVISMRLKELYQMLTLGGDAELELVDSLDPFSEGIVFSVRPPKKSWKQIQNLSGGEKTLSSLALVFALHQFRPNPLYVMDEIDAALDFKNVSIVANYIKERTKNAQFIIISLRNNMFELADRLVGIYKTSNQTKSITIDPRKFVLPSAAMPPPHPLDEKRPPLAQPQSPAPTPSKPSNSVASKPTSAATASTVSTASAASASTASTAASKTRFRSPRRHSVDADID